MLKSFAEEHGLSLPDNYPVQPTYMHESISASSQIDYWFVRPVERESVSIGSQYPENLSDHVEVVFVCYVIADTLIEKLRASGSNMRAHVVHALYSSLFFVIPLLSGCV